MVFDKAGNLYLADYYAIRMITPDGTVKTIAGQVKSKGDVLGEGKNARFDFIRDLLIDKDGQLFVLESSTIKKIDQDHQVSLHSKLPYRVYGHKFAIDSNNNFYFSYQHIIRKMAPDKTVSVFAGDIDSGVADGKGTEARFYNIQALTVGEDDHLYVVDNDNHLLRKITQDAVVSIAAGVGSKLHLDNPALTAGLSGPIAAVKVGNQGLYIFDYYGRSLRAFVEAGFLAVRQLQSMPEFCRYVLLYLMAITAKTVVLILTSLYQIVSQSLVVYLRPQ